MVMYTDDCLIFAKENQTIDELIKNLSDTFIQEDQGSMNDFLGIRIISDPTAKTISMTQPGLIDSIITDLSINDKSNMKTTLADSILHHDSSGIPCQETWNPSKISQLLGYDSISPDLS